MIAELFGQRLLDNTMRGYWCESMVAEALGAECKIVGQGWHAWDLQIGADADRFPQRIRIQVKNSARLQPWNITSGKPSECKFDLKVRKKPYYFDQNNSGIPCEEIGFLCDIFILCFHSEVCPETADHTNPQQWLFFLVPVVGPHSAITAAEWDYATQRVKSTGKPSVCMRRPETLERGIRGRPPIPPIEISELTVESVRMALR